MPLERAKTLAFWIAPPLVALCLYWPGLTSWFQKDDFVWLSLRQLVGNGHDLGWALFAPMAQGTIRTLSERAFFLSFSTLFGLDPLPYRCLAFLTHAATLTALSAVCTKMTASRAAGFWAAILYTINGILVYPLSWTSIYNEILFAFVLLLSLWLLIRYVETGNRRYYVSQWVTFVLGFGVLELNVVYPAIATVYVLCFARGLLRKVLPMFALSAIYSVVHIVVAPMSAGGTYHMFWDLRMFPTLWTYWKLALGPTRLVLLHIYPSAGRSVLTAALTIALLGFLISKLARRQWAAALMAAWFLIVIAPLLPLRNHVTEYYLTAPLLGLAMLGGWGVIEGWRSSPPLRIATVALLALYVVIAIPVARVSANSFHDSSQRVRTLIEGVVSHNQPDKLILLRGVDCEMYLAAWYNRPLRLYGIENVYIAPEDAPLLTSGKCLDNADRPAFFPDATVLSEALARNRAIVLDVSGGEVRDITSQYRIH